MSDEIGLYSDPEVYDILHRPGTKAEFRGLERAARATISGRSRERWTVLEPACGTGRLLTVAAAGGHRALGFDLSPSMVEYATAKLELAGGLGHKVFVADMTDFAETLGRTRVDVAFCPINTIRHLSSDADMLAHFEQMSKVLGRGGVYLVGITVSLPGMESPSEDVWKGARGRVRVQQIVSFMPPERGRFERVHSHLIVTDGAGTEHRDSAYRLRCYSREQWGKLLERSALRTAGIFDADGEPMEAPAIGYGVWALAARG